MLVATSGGADSVALLLGLHSLAARQGLTPRLIVVHARHDLREEADADAAFVGDLAGRLACPCVIRDLPVRSAEDPRGEGVEALARRMRLGFFSDVALECGARHVVVAHTADDQAETILHRILRGTGPAGLQGMAPARELCDGVALVRPLLTVRRRVIRDYLESCGQPWCEDATNADVRYSRNFLRHHVLASCETGPYPAATAAINRLGDQVAGLAGAIRSAAEHLLDGCAQRHHEGSILIRSAPLASLDAQFVAEVFVALWHREAWPQRDMTSRHYAMLARMVADSVGLVIPPAVDLPGGVRARGAAHGMLMLERPAGR